MGPETLCRPGGVTEEEEEGDTSGTGELTVLLGGVVFPDAAPRRFLTFSSEESFLPNTFLLDLKMKKHK